MWHLVDWDNGIIEQATAKKDIMKKWYKTKRNANHYEVYDISCGENTFIGWLYRSKTDLIEDGWSWVFHG